VIDSDNLGRLTPPVNPERPTRRERAQDTRRRMLDAADGLFVEHGYAGTRMTDVAEVAGVAVQTVYFTFHTKAELLQACHARAVMGDDSLPPEKQPFWAAMIAADTGEDALRHFVDGVAEIAARVAQLDQVVSSATHEPEAMAIWTRSEELRRAGFRKAVEHIAGRFGLRDGLDAGTATDILLTMGGHPVYLSLVHDYGWSQEAFCDWLSGALGEMLLRA
jgi:AcrR family transcriptional regulator